MGERRGRIPGRCLEPWVLPFSIKVLLHKADNRRATQVAKWRAVKKRKGAAARSDKEGYLGCCILM